MERVDIIMGSKCVAVQSGISQYGLRLINSLMKNGKDIDIILKHETWKKVNLKKAYANTKKRRKYVAGQIINEY